ncbi:hypothetical protein [Gallaecimonas sp. GXIMD4217]|uniref:hypothetical protein n=1 Tax=Gallaecimonas sp. GXIMD4217 TaxID=3131927 RepID=UPI00311B2FCC
MKGYLKFGAGLALGLGLGAWLFGGQGQRPSPEQAHQAAPAASVAATATGTAETKTAPAPQRPQAGPSPVATPAAPTPGGETVNVELLQEMLAKRASFEQDWYQTLQERVYDDRAVKAEQAIWDGIALAQQKVDVSLDETICDSGKVCMVKLNLADQAYSSMVTEQLMSSLGKADFNVSVATQDSTATEHGRRLQLRLYQQPPEGAFSAEKVFTGAPAG